MTTAPRKLSLLTLAWPIFIEQGLRVLIQTVDTLMVSHISDDAVAALGVASQVLVLALTLFNFVAIGSSVVITHALGSGNRRGADQIAATAVTVNGRLGLIVSALVCILAAPILHLLQLPGRLLPFALPFLTFMGSTLFLEALNTSMAAILRAHLHTRDAMFVTAAQNVLNVIGNCLLLFGLCGFPKLGVLGVALSGVVSRVIACGTLFYILRRRTSVRIHLSDWFTLPRDRIRNILRIGLPAAGENINWWLAFIVVTSFTSRMGPTSLATQSYTMQITMWIILLGLSIGISTELLVGHRVGAGQFAEAYVDLLRNLRSGFILVVGAVILVALSAPHLLRLFTSDPVIIAGAALLLRMGLLLEPGRVFNVIVINSLRATGDTQFPLFMGCCSTWGLWVPLAWLLGLKLGLGLPGIWISMAADEWLRGSLMYWRWKRRGWVKYARHSRARAAAARAA